MNARWLGRSTTIEAGQGQVHASGEQVQRARGRRELWWAWASLFVLIVAWDAASRLDDRVAPPRMRIVHAVEEEGRTSQRIDRADL